MQPGPRQAWVGAALLGAVCLAVYANSFGGVFLYDDLIQIVGNQRIRSFGWQLWGARPLVDLTLALNYRMGGLETWGYHAVNVVVHLLAALTLFGLLRRTLRLERYRATMGRHADGLALAVALLWMVHPLQTESVTYLIQRAEAMAGLFYLLVLYCMVRAEGSPRPAWWLTGAVAACAAGLCAKPVLVTAPIVALLFDVLVIGRGWRAVAPRWWFYAGLASSWALLPATGTVQTMFATEPSPYRAAGLSYTSISPLEYAITQPGVILHYLRLAVWPRPLCLHYEWPVAATPGAVIGPALALAALLAASALSWRRRPHVAFLGLSFFAVLAPTSSVMPLADPAVEHRMYLALAAVSAAAVLGAGALMQLLAEGGVPGRTLAWASRLLVVAAVSALAAATIDRNADYRDPLRMWLNLVEARPENPNAWNDLASTLWHRGALAEAEASYVQALRLDPGACLIRAGYAGLLLQQGRLGPAERHARQSLLRCSFYAPAHYVLGRALVLRSGLIDGDGPADAALVDEGVACMVAAIRARPQYGPAVLHLAEAIERQGDIDAAAKRWLGSDRLLVPAHAQAWVRAGRERVRQGRSLEAERCFRRALEIDPASAPAQQGLGEAQAAALSTAAD